MPNVGSILVSRMRPGEFDLLDWLGTAEDELEDGSTRVEEAREELEVVLETVEDELVDGEGEGARVRAGVGTGRLGGGARPPFGACATTHAARQQTSRPSSSFCLAMVVVVLRRAEESRSAVAA